MTNRSLTSVIGYLRRTTPNNHGTVPIHQQLKGGFIARCDEAFQQLCFGDAATYRRRSVKVFQELREQAQPQLLWKP
jgi:hypothetical protein